ncbi:glycerol-3-phosphate dehydrogenase [Marivivens sp. JLT3646]|uniref:glycerol-3-phosphate dehydrogenase n=1 Tax=Marivivens sp. JLT3646 TaxID=1920883 RepID=UPI0007FE2F67|nr:glycerol-3-phosphate dehydrogenase [Marivivens sp. JLT3646]APO87750.1 glycerol-3-phosphate dehydrogenase [Marivivens sp. JLT3646]OBR36330.1 glycerol-3-phosphate dehydrogenase [Donghicola sp. JL3646]
MTDQIHDLFIIGGGINGCGIARDAAGRGLSVVLAEQGDLASATSSASTKLFHGGLRYLEYFEFRLVREALIERETLLQAMPHISWPMRFVLPYHDSMRFEGATPTSRLLNVVMPWMKGRRPAWLIRLGLFLYDHLGGREILPPTQLVDLRTAVEGEPLLSKFETAYEYSDCWVEDARLVALNARDAVNRGARVLTRTKVIAADRLEDHWVVTLEDVETGEHSTERARMLINAAGPWVGNVIANTLRLNSRDGVRLVRGSHIVTKRLYDHDKCYFFQGTDGRIIFAIPYETDFTLIGTTDAEHHDVSEKPLCTEDERDYLIRFANGYFKRQLTADDVVWTYSGVRPLHDDGSSSATAATRDYTLKVDDTGGAPILNIFGGKITTYRRLAEAAMAKVKGYVPDLKPDWTAGVPLPGGDFPVDGVDHLIVEARIQFPFLEDRLIRRLVRGYGTDLWTILGQARSIEELGQHFGATLYEAEVNWLMEHEFAREAEDVLWRRTKLGLRFEDAEVEALDAWMRDKRRS